MPPKKPAPRRGQARATILATARELFSQAGYDGTSLRDVATQAQVSEGLVYRYFGSKRGLFDAAVTQTYGGYITDFLERWGRTGAGLSNEEGLELYVRGLYEVVTQNSSLLFTLAAADRFGSDVDSAGILTREVRLLAGAVAVEARERGLEHVDLEMALSCTTALVLGMVLLDNLLFEKGENHPDPERMLREMSRFAAGGVRATTPD